MREPDIQIVKTSQQTMNNVIIQKILVFFKIYIIRLLIYILIRWNSVGTYNVHVNDLINILPRSLLNVIIIFLNYLSRYTYYRIFSSCKLTISKGSKLRWHCNMIIFSIERKKTVFYYEKI